MTHTHSPTGALHDGHHQRDTHNHTDIGTGIQHVHNLPHTRGWDTIPVLRKHNPTPVASHRHIYAGPAAYSCTLVTWGHPIVAQGLTTILSQQPDKYLSPSLACWQEPSHWHTNPLTQLPDTLATHLEKTVTHTNTHIIPALVPES